MRRIGAATGVGLAVLAVPASAQAPAVAITVDAPKRLVADGAGSFTVKARVTGLDGPYDLDLVGTSPAYPGERVFTLAAQRGTRFEAVPAVTAAYRVQALDGNTVLATSRRVTVVAHPRITLSSKRVGGGLELRTKAVLHRGELPLRIRAGSATEALFYYRLDGSAVYKRLAAADLTDSACRRRKCVREAAHTIYDTTLLSGIRSFLVCVPGRAFAGAGESARCAETIKA